MPVSVTCTSVNVEADGSRNVSFDDGISLDFGSIEDVRAMVDELETRETARRFLLGAYLAVDRDGSDTAAILGRTATINVGARNPVQIG